MDLTRICDCQIDPVADPTREEAEFRAVPLNLFINAFVAAFDLGFWNRVIYTRTKRHVPPSLRHFRGALWCIRLALRPVHLATIWDREISSCEELCTLCLPISSSIR